VGLFGSDSSKIALPVLVAAIAIRPGGALVTIETPEDAFSRALLLLWEQQKCDHQEN
jgi:hypothetical protein